VTIRSSRGKE